MNLKTNIITIEGRTQKFNYSAGFCQMSNMFGNCQRIFKSRSKARNSK